MEDCPGGGLSWWRNVLVEDWLVGGLPAGAPPANRAAPTSPPQYPASGEASLPPPPSPPPPESVHATKSISLPSPEKERGSLAVACSELKGSPIHFQREEAQTCEQEKTSYSFYDVGTQMCPACDFDMCFPILDSIDISCKCFVGEDSR